MPSYVIAGASLAGAKAAETLRDEGFDGDIVLIGSESERPYERPPLSKGYLLGSDARDSVYVHAAGWYAENGVDLREGITVTAIDRSARIVAITGQAGAAGYVLRQAAARHRRLAASAEASPGPTARRCSTSARWAIPTGSVRRSSRVPGSWWPGPAGSAWRRPRPPHGRVRGDVLEPQSGALTDSSDRAGAVFAICTGRTAWSSGSARRVSCGWYSREMELCDGQKR